jgi:hypothetical protein
MSDLGDLTDFILEGNGGGDTDSSLADLEWLYPDIDEYRKTQALPRQNLDSIPELEESWGYLTDADRFRLSPENRRPANPNTPFWSERPQPGLTTEARVQALEGFLRKQLQNGVVASQALELVKKNFDSDSIRLASTNIKKALSERGLIGHVYVDQSLLPDTSRKTQDHVRKKNASAQYLLVEEGYQGSSWVENNRCGKFEKRLIFDVDDIDYTPELWEHYKGRALAQGKDLSGITADMSIKEKIRAANLAPFKTSVKGLDGKPVQKDFAQDVTAAEARTSLAEAVVVREKVENRVLTEKIRTYAMRMLHEPHGPELRDALMGDADLETLKPHMYLMGHLYADLSYFDDAESAQTYLKAHPSVVPYGTPGEGKTASQTPSLRSRELVSQIVYRYALQKFGHDHDGALLAKLANRLYKMEDSKLRRFAYSVYSKPVPEAVRQYDRISPVIYDPTQGVSAKVAHRALKAARIDRLKIHDPAVAREKKAFLMVMAMGQRSEDLREAIVERGYDDVLQHWNLQGNTYLLTDGFTDQEVSTLLKKRASLKTLPQVTTDTLPSLVTSDAFRTDVFKRYASLEKGEGRKVQASFAKRFASFTPGDLLEFANAVYGQQARKQAKTYLLGNQKTQDNLDVESGKRHIGGELDLNRKAYTPTAQDISDFKRRSQDQEQVRVSRDLAYYAKREGGKKVLGMMAARFTPEVVANVYFPNQSASSQLKNATDRTRQEDTIVATVTDPNFKPLGLKESTILPDFFSVQLGRWLRDEISSGVHGARLSEKIATSLTREQIVDHAPIILSLREEEGLLGRAYLRADAYGDCREGVRAAKASAKQVVKASKCDGCVYNREGSCLLYSRPLTASPEYDAETFRTAMSHRISQGQLTKEDAQLLMSLNESAKELTRKAHTVKSQTHTRVAEKRYEGHYGSVMEQGKAEKKVVAMLQKARTLILDGSSKADMLMSLSSEFGPRTVKMGSVYLDQIYDRTTSSIEDHVDATHIHAPTGIDQMFDMELTASQVANPYEDLDLGEEKDSKPIDIMFGGFTE